MKKFLAFIPLICAALLFCACDEDQKEISPVAIFINPEASHIEQANSGDKCFFHIDFYTENDYVSRLKITSKDKFQGMVDLLDISWDAPIKDYDFVYTAPITNKDSMLVYITFEAWDNMGNKCSTERIVNVINKRILIEEQSGIVLWAEETGRANALSFASPTKTFNLLNSSEADKADFIVDTDISFETITLRSNTATKFVRNNSFDYASTTAISLQASYEASKSQDIIEDLRINDIILVGHNETAEGVFRIVNIIRTAGDENCVQMAFKGISNKNSDNTGNNHTDEEE